MGRENALRACELAAVASGSADDLKACELKACVVERAALRELADELASLESGWSQVGIVSENGK